MGKDTNALEENKNESILRIEEDINSKMEIYKNQHLCLLIVNELNII